MGWSLKVAADWMVAMAAGSSAVATDPEEAQGHTECDLHLFKNGLWKKQLSNNLQSST